MKEACTRIVTLKPVDLKSPVKRSRKELERTQGDDSIDWEIELSEAEGVNDEEGKLLTSLVRRAYIHHLQKSLLHNYESWFKSYGDGVELSSSVIARCAAQLEKKALRSCMLASLYQHSVVKQIKSIKKSTDHKKLYEDLLASLNCPKRCDKGIQTNDTDSTLSNHNTTDTAILPVENANGLAASCVESAVGSTPIQGANHVAYVTNNLNKQSFDLPPAPVPNPYQFPEAKPTPPKFVLSYLPKNHGNSDSKSLKTIAKCTSNIDSNIPKIYDPELDTYTEERCSQLDNQDRGIKRKGHPQESSLKKRKSSLEITSQRTLEERLKKFEEIFGDPCEDVPPDPQPPDKPMKCNYTKFFSLVSWKQESIAQTCELNKKLLMLPPAHLRTFKSRLKRLFGSIDPIIEITPEQFTHCRKRLANIIVFQLTPYFDLGQIGSRVIFKALAKEITRIILSNTYAADMAFSQSVVDEIFQNGTKYKSLEDVNILCSR